MFLRVGERAGQGREESGPVLGRRPFLAQRRSRIWGQCWRKVDQENEREAGGRDWQDGIKGELENAVWFRRKRRVLGVNKSSKARWTKMEKTL